MPVTSAAGTGDAVHDAGVGAPGARRVAAGAALATVAAAGAAARTAPAARAARIWMRIGTSWVVMPADVARRGRVEALAVVTATISWARMAPLGKAAVCTLT